jgi:hypothetical protein
VASRVWLVSFSGIVIETTVCDRADVADAWIRTIRLKYFGL